MPEVFASAPIVSNRPNSARRRRWIASGSALAVSLALSAPAYADCTPDPAAAGGTVTCSGTDANGYVVNVANVTVNVDSGASVNSGGASAFVVNIPADGQFGPRNVTLNVAGSVSGSPGAGVALFSGPVSPTQFFDFYGTSARINVEGTGQINGLVGVRLASTQGNQFGTVYAQIDNAGTISGTSGVALFSVGNNASFTSIINRASGQIGAIFANLGTLDNAGTIDGGTLSAINVNSGNFSFGSWTNSGTIRNNSNSATIGNFFGANIVNSGTIANAGSGGAIASAQVFGGYSYTVDNSGTISSTGGTAIAGSFVNVTNRAGATISGGATAITANDSLTLTNSGRIIGDVVSNSGYFNGSYIDSTNGTITGNLRFSNSNDRLVAVVRNGQLVTGVSGTIDGSGGTDTVIARLTGNNTLTAPIALPTNFEILALSAEADSTTTLASTFSNTGSLSITSTGAATVINQASLRNSSNTVVVSADYGYRLTFRNEGSITAEAGNFFFDFNSAALNATSNIDIVNSGSITGFGNITAVNGGNLVNTGTITADATAASLFGSRFNNSGTITSNSGVGLMLNGGTGALDNDRVNSGTIRGGSQGAILNATLVNTGTISGATGVQLGSYGVLDNRAGGVVNGGVNTGFNTFTFNNALLNAGTINGDVTLAGSTFYPSWGGDVFALAGGVINGNLSLGPNSTLHVQAGASGPFAGVTGTVTANASNLRYQVRGTTTVDTLAIPSGFTTLGFEMFDKASLTASSRTPLASTLTVGGTGTADLTIDVTTTNTPGLTAGGLYQLGGNFTPADLAITSRGNISVTGNGPYFNFYSGAVTLDSGISFTNAGTITITDNRTRDFFFPQPLAAITGSGNVTNSGSIVLSRAIGITTSGAVVNSGTITEAVGSSTSIGISGGSSVINSGTIRTGGSAIVLGGFNGRVTNSGSIVSTGAVAIGPTQNYGYNSNILLDNLAGGTISGGTGFAAILAQGGQISNAGTINGNVDLSGSSFGFSYATSRFIDRGGTVNGSVLFGSANDLFIETTGQTGVTGIIDGGGGTNTFGHVRTSSGTVAFDLPANVRNFQAQFIAAIGADTVVTTRSGGAFAGDLAIGGAGTVVNTVDIGGVIYSDQSVSDIPMLGSFVNRASVGRALLQVASFTNSGTVGSLSGGGTVVSVDALGTLAFENSGSILGGSGFAPYPYYPFGPTVALRTYTAAAQLTAANSGTIAGNGLQITNYGAGGSTRLDNSGSITVDQSGYDGVGIQASNGNVTLANSGTISSGVGGGTAANINIAGENATTLTFDNIGTIAATGLAATGVDLSAGAAATFVVTNSGKISSDGGTATYPFYYFIYDPATNSYIRATYTPPAIALSISAPGDGTMATATVTNAATGVISATGFASTAISVIGMPLQLTNFGSVIGGSGFALDETDIARYITGQTYRAGAIQTYGVGGSSITNAGSITGSIDLAGGGNSLANTGTITGDLFMRGISDPYPPVPELVPGSNSVTNGGTITGAIDISGGSNRFDNAGTITGNVVLGSADPSKPLTTVFGSNQASNGGTLDGSLTISGGSNTLGNTGTITGAVLVGGGDPAIQVGTVIGGNAITNGGRIGGSLNVSGSGNSLANTGAIGGDVVLGSDAPGGLTSVSGSNSVTNGGSIGGALSVLGGGIVFGNTGRVAGNVVLGGGSGLAGGNAVTNGGTLGGSLSVSGAANTLANTGAIAGDVALGNGDASVSGSNTVNNGGTIGGALSVLGGGIVFGNTGRVTGNVVLGGGSGLAGGNAVTNGGTLGGLLSVSGGGNTLANTGTISGAVLLGGGDAAGQGGNGVTNGGTIGGALTLSGGGNRIVNTGRIGGNVAVGTSAAPRAGSVGGNGLSNAGTIAGSIDLAGGGNSIANTGAITGDVFLRGGGNAFGQLATATVGGTVTAEGAGNTLVIQAANGGRINASGFVGFASATQQGTGTVTYAGSFDAPTLTVNGGNVSIAAGTRFGTAGATAITGSAAPMVLTNAGTIAGNVALGSGADDYFDLAGSAVTGTVDGGAGANVFHVVLAGARTAIAAQRNFPVISLEGTGSLTLASPLAFGTGADSTLAIAAGTALSLPQVLFGGGNDRLQIAGQFTGSADGGAGSDAILVSGGSEAAPIAFTNLANFESYGQTAGFARISGTAALQSIDLAGGRLVGLAGSTITAPTIVVRSGATFGSAGTVNGNIAVAGTLSPGASPGTMTVNGNLTLAPGSVSLFEITPTVSDQLIVNGALTIAAGAALQVTSTGPVAAGSVRELISASGGISGSFASITVPADIQGFVTPFGGRLQLFGALTVPTVSSGDPVAAGATGYLNARLLAGNAAVLRAIPGLLTSSGQLSASALARLAPQPQAAALELGSARGIGLANALRGPGMGARSASVQPFAFGQVIGGWQSLGARAATGIAATNTYTRGGFGGLGVSGPNWSIGAFAGRIDSTQTLTALGARNRAEGTVFGAQAQLDLGRLSFSAAVIRDLGDGFTRRTTADGLTATSSYTLRAWTYAGSASTRLPLGKSWQVSPHVDLTYTWVTRGAASETSASPFALTVAGRKQTAGLVSAGARFGLADDAAGAFRPWIDLGVTGQWRGKIGIAQGGFAGGPVTLGAYGAQRSPVSGWVRTGGEWAVAPALRLFASGSVNLAAHQSDEALQAGVRLAF